MKTRRGNPLFLLLLLLLTLLGTLLLAFLPSHEAAKVKTSVVHHMVATMDGWMHRFGVPQEMTANLTGRIPWGGLGLFAAAVALFGLRRHRRHF